MGTGATLTGKDGHFLAARPNKWDQYQDYGHSHWYDSFLVGDGLSNVTITGAGILDGGGLSTHEPKAGGGCRLIALRSCSAVTIQGLTARNGGWFTLLATNVSGLVLQDLIVHAARDAFDIVSCRCVCRVRVLIRAGAALVHTLEWLCVYICCRPRSSVRLIFALGVC